MKSTANITRQVPRLKIFIHILTLQFPHLPTTTRSPGRVVYDKRKLLKEYVYDKPRIFCLWVFALLFVLSAAIIFIQGI